MVYFIYGKQNIRIKSQTKAIIKKSLPEVDDMNLVRFDGNNTVIQECIDEANYIPIGYDYKVVIVENCYYFGKTKTKNKINADQDFDVFKNYLKNPNPNCDLILTYADEIDTKNEFFQIIQNNHQVVEVKDPNPSEWVDVVKKYIVEKLNVAIDYDALKEFSNRTNCDYGLLFNNANKLALYTDHITLNDVLLMVSRPLDDNYTFQLFNHLMNGQNMRAVSLYRDLKITNFNPIILISLLANQFRLLDEVFYLFSLKYTNDDIAKELAIKPIRVSIMGKYYRIIKQEKIKSILVDLYKLDKDIKSGQIDRDYGFELFLINFRVEY